MHQVKLTSSKHDIHASKAKHKSQGSILPKPKIPNDIQQWSHLEEVHLCIPVPNSGKGSYASQPHGTHRSTPIVLMETIIQPKTHIEQHPWLSLTPNSKED
jgi:hypothetical protein